MATRYPIYVISKGRWKIRLTTDSLERMHVDYKIVIEPQEYENYSAVIDSKKILVLPFSNLGQGGIPARNWVWEHSIAQGFKRHWILDDNIEMFYRYNNNMKNEALTDAIFRASEDFVDRYENVPMAGFNYAFFINANEKHSAYFLNNRVYSCILLDNTETIRWRGRYNEDSDLALRFLKQGKCTILFNTFLAGKKTTMKLAGGNTDQLYQGDGRKKMAKSLIEQHPDCVTMYWRFGRWQHKVDYSQFANNKLIKKPNLPNYPKVDNYGMKLVEFPTTK